MIQRTRGKLNLNTSFLKLQKFQVNMKQKRNLSLVCYNIYYRNILCRHVN